MPGVSEFFTTETVRDEPWWAKDANRNRVLALGTAALDSCEDDVNSVYVYNLSEVTRNFEKLKQLKSINKVFYAMKANPNVEILRHLNSLGCCFECVSVNELKLLLELDNTICGSRILFTPNFACKREYTRVRALFDTEARRAVTAQSTPFVTIDNLWTLENWECDTFAGLDLFLRVDPGFDGLGHHKYVQTGSDSKFGMSRDELLTFLGSGHAVIRQVVGLHMHKGSGITDTLQWQKSASALLELSPHIPNLKFLDLGGGIGVPYQPTQASLNLSALDEKLYEVTAKYPEITFMIEPGRFMVCTSEVLLVRVNQLKEKPTVKFVGCSAGMNALIRPCLYEAYHHIVNLSKFDQAYLGAGNVTEEIVAASNADHFDVSAGLKEAVLVNVVGPICETGDFLGKHRVFPKSTAEGDIIAIDNVGAYGVCLATQYNLRKIGEEIAFIE